MDVLFAAWVKKQIRRAPDDICAFCFNLYEERGGFSLDVVGSTVFLIDDPDWASREDFVPTPRRRRKMPKTQSGPDWESCLEAVTQNIQYLLDKKKIAKFVDAEAVAVGFVDGDLHLLKPKTTKAV